MKGLRFAAAALTLVCLAGCAETGEPDAAPAEAHFVQPEGVETLTAAPGASLSFPAGSPQEGYVFLGWRDEAGVVHTGEETAESGWYAASYAPALDLERHDAYMEVSPEGFFYPDRTVTRAEAAQILYALLLVKPESDAEFTDLDENDGARRAAVCLKGLGVIRGDAFRGEDPLTLREWMDWISALYPPQEGPDRAQRLFVRRGWITWAELGERDRALSRIAFCRVTNRILGRSTAAVRAEEQVGVILDVDPMTADYGTAAEACVSHTYRVGKTTEHEIWLKSTPAAILEDGLCLTGTTLRCVRNGVCVRDGEADGFLFGPDGTYTSGNEELDALVRETLDALNEPGLDRWELLKRCYDYTAEISYVGGTFYGLGEKGWEDASAIQGLRERSGNCYVYAATFRSLGRALGYDLEALSSLYGIDCEQHAWCELTLEGEEDNPYLFDPQQTYRYRQRFLGDPEQFWCMGRTKAMSFGYQHAPWRFKTPEPEDGEDG